VKHRACPKVLSCLNTNVSTHLSSIVEMASRRHSSPWSIWTRLLSTPLLFVPVWNRSWIQGLGVGAWFAVNPVLFREPRDPNGWHARAIRGELRWMRERPLDRALAVQTFGSVAGFGGMYAAQRRKLAPVVASAVVVMACNAWFLSRMARTYGVDPD